MVCRDASLANLRENEVPEVPAALKEIEKLTLKVGDQAPPVQEEIAALFPNSSLGNSVSFSPGKENSSSKALKVGVLFSGGQAAGGHNVIAGLYDALKRLNSGSTLYGFLNGPDGVINNEAVALDAEVIAPYRNQGGFDLIGSGRTKIESEEQFQRAMRSAKSLDLDGLVVIGGDDSNTNAALLSEYFIKEGVKTAVVGVPKTIDGDLKSADIELSFGFDTATKCYSATIGDIARDALSAKKYYFFIKLMGRSASHITLECALKTEPNLALISEEIKRKGQTIDDVVDEIANLIMLRSDHGKEYGVILIPEGIIEFVKELKNSLEGLPNEIRESFDLKTDPHGNLPVSKIESERLLIALVKKELKKRGFSGSFSAQPHFCGYEGRSCLPSRFDGNYCYALGLVAALLVRFQKTGYMALIRGLKNEPNLWQPGGVPIIPMLTIEKRKGREVPVIKKALVDLEGELFSRFANAREKWQLQDAYKTPGPIQFFGPKELSENITETLKATS